MSTETKPPAGERETADVQQAREWLLKNHRNVDTLLFVAQPSGKRLYLDHVLAAFAYNETTKLTAERDELKRENARLQGEVEKLRQGLEWARRTCIRYELSHKPISDALAPPSTSKEQKK